MTTAMSAFEMPRKAYRTPAVRERLLEYENVITDSQLEGIQGGDDPDIDW